MVDFNPRSPHGERQTSMPAPSYMSAFQPTLPARGATCCRISHTSTRQPFQPTLPARGATVEFARKFFQLIDFNPRSPHGERRAVSEMVRVLTGDFNPRSPHGERRRRHLQWHRAGDFNPRSPHGERRRTATHKRRHERFQPTLPARGATKSRRAHARKGQISTHAPRTGSDDGRRRTSAAAKDFNPRSPHGERPRGGDERGGGMAFQPTLPARGAT